jgi:hypothetical protein
MIKRLKNLGLSSVNVIVDTTELHFLEYLYWNYFKIKLLCYLFVIIQGIHVRFENSILFRSKYICWFFEISK